MCVLLIFQICHTIPLPALHHQIKSCYLLGLLLIQIHVLNQLNLYVNATTISSYKILDNLGNIVLSKDVNSQKVVKVNTSKLASGLYLVKVATPAGNIQKNIIKQ